MMKQTNDRNSVNQTQERNGEYMTKSEFAFKMQEEVLKKSATGFKIELVQKEEYNALKFIPPKNLQLTFGIIIEKYYDKLNQYFNDKAQARTDTKNILEKLAIEIIEEYNTLINWVDNEIKKRHAYKESTDSKEEQEDEIELE